MAPTRACLLFLSCLATFSAAPLCVLGHPAPPIQQPQWRLVDSDPSKDQQQRPVVGGPAADAVKWPVYWQDDRTCRANTRHFTGTAPVSHGNGLFFWFFESRSSPLTSPTILWLNGGPGASSLPGLFEEIGPCQVDPFNNSRTISNPDSWANFANLLILDQPAGVGLSPLAKGSSFPLNLGEASVDFRTFLESFIARFPQYFEHGFYLAGESFGGQYVPRFVSDILGHSRGNTRDIKDNIINNSASLPKPAASPVAASINGIILVDPAVDVIYSYLGHYELFCSGAQDILQFNASACADISAAMPELERLDRLCQATSDPHVCASAEEYGRLKVYKYFQEEVDARRRSPYDMRQGCDVPPTCIPKMLFEIEPYLSNQHLQSLLGIKATHNYSSVNWELNERWGNDPAVFVPSTNDVVYLLDEAKIRMLVMNGKYDVAITSAGIFREFDELPWSKGAQYRLTMMRDWDYTDKEGILRRGGRMKGIAELQVAEVDNAGHTSPGDQKEAVSALVRAWLVR